MDRAGCNGVRLESKVMFNNVGIRGRGSIRLGLPSTENGISVSYHLTLLLFLGGASKSGKLEKRRQRNKIAENIEQSASKIPGPLKRQAPNWCRALISRGKCQVQSRKPPPPIPHLAPNLSSEGRCLTSAPYVGRGGEGEEPLISHLK